LEGLTMARQMTLLESMRDDSKRLRDMLSDGFNRLFADAKLITPPLASSAIPKEPGAVFDAWCSVSGLARQDEAWIGMIIFGNKQPCTGNLPKKPKMPS